MKKSLFFITAVLFISSAFSQKTDTAKKANSTPTTTAPATVQTTPAKKDWSKVDLSHRANDHFMIQTGYVGWAALPDTVPVNGISRSFNFYFMYDFPFKTDPRFSVGAGLGISCSNAFFKNQPYPLSTTPRQDDGGGTHFKKYKVVTTYLDIPVELRYALDPENTNKSWKFAAGIKVGDLLSAYSKGKDVLNGTGQDQDPSVYKDRNNSNFNSIRLATTVRISKGPIGVYGQYQVTSLMKGSQGLPLVYPFEFGICLSGL
jgi:hypothetical protein